MVNQIDSGSDEIEYISLIIDRTKEIEFERRKFDIISHAEESEKKKIARELHDGLGQQMVLLNLLFQNFNPSDDQKESYTDLSNLLQSCIREVKEIAYNLLPPELEKGFLNAMERFAHRVNAIGEIQFRIEIKDDIEESDLEKVDKFNLYRIIQEVFNNAVKHSQAETFTVQICRGEKNKIEISASDNGVGFDMEKVQKGLGLENINYRINMSGVQGEFSSEIGKGTAINLIL